MHLSFGAMGITTISPFSTTLLSILALATSSLFASAIPVHHLEGVTFGFLVMRDLDGHAIAYGRLKQAVKPGDPVITDDVQFEFKDGSYYHEITRFTQRGIFRLVSDHVVKKGPSFKQQSESWIDARSGKITVRDLGNGKQSTKQMALPPDVSNGLLFILVKNMNPSAAETTVAMVAASDKPRVVKLVFTPAEEKTVKVGTLEFKAQHYVMKVKIEGVAGKVAPLVGKQPPDSNFWVIKSESPTFAEFEGPVSADSPVWRIELVAPESDRGDTQAEQKKSSSPQ